MALAEGLMANLDDLSLEQLQELKKAKQAQVAQGIATVGQAQMSGEQTQISPMGNFLPTFSLGVPGGRITIRPQTPKTSPKIPQRQLELLQDTFFVISGLRDLENRMKTEKYATGIFSPRFYPGVKGDIPMQIRGTPKEASFKADTDKLFQKYRKVTTGVQAGYPELAWLAADMPKTTDRPDIYLSKTEGSINQNIENAKNMIVTLRGAGYDVTNFENQLNQIIGGTPTSKETVDKETVDNDPLGLR